MKTVMIKFLHIICYKWGTRYSSKDVNILYAMVKRNISIPFKMHCITDDPREINSDIIIESLPAEAMIGKAPKLYTFSSGFLGLSSEDYVVSLDLDIVVVGSLDFLAEHPENDFVIAPHRTRKGKMRVHGAVYRLRVGSLSDIWEKFIENTEEHVKDQNRVGANNVFSEQTWLEANLEPSSVRFFPSNKVISFRGDCSAKVKRKIFGIEWSDDSFVRRFLLEKFKAKLPNIGEAVVSFAGPTLPRHVVKSHTHDMRHAPFVEEHWRAVKIVRELSPHMTRIKQ